jgi:hypothetical protein
MFDYVLQTFAAFKIDIGKAMHEDLIIKEEFMKKIW